MKLRDEFVLRMRVVVGFPYIGKIHQAPFQIG